MFACKSGKRNAECYDDVCEEPETFIDCPRDCWLADMQLVLGNAGRVDWSQDGSNIIAYDVISGPDGYYDVALMNPNASGIKCLTCNVPGLPQKNNGNPAWHPGGDWIAFQSEKQNHGGTSEFSTPSKGVFNDLWIISTDGTKVHQLTDYANNPNNGVLNPVFSPDGTKIAWSRLLVTASAIPKEIYGQWRIEIANFSVVNDTPRVSNIITTIPGDNVYYAIHGFSPDGQHLLFSSNMYTLQPPPVASQLFRLKVSDQSWEALTDAGYNEHASYVPHWDKIIWGTDLENDPGNDYWLMNTDGTNKERLTFFNFPGYFESQPGPCWAGDMAWHPSGKWMMFYVEKDPILELGDIYMMFLN
ncbi:MAG: hypothetical protein HKN22_06380 [Bacteroidia bacterium]|nr:hypothetical protein [Bacteroidia bacterium]